MSNPTGKAFSFFSLEGSYLLSTEIIPSCHKCSTPEQHAYMPCPAPGTSVVYIFPDLFINFHTDLPPCSVCKMLHPTAQPCHLLCTSSDPCPFKCIGHVSWPCNHCHQDTHSTPFPSSPVSTPAPVNQLQSLWSWLTGAGVETGDEGNSE